MSFTHAFRNGYWRLMDGCEPVDWFLLERLAREAAAYCNEHVK